jgi:hypothetical protein
MKLEVIMLNVKKRKQTEKDKCYMFFSYAESRPSKMNDWSIKRGPFGD